RGAGRWWWPPPEPSLEEAPVDGTPQLCQRVGRINDLIEPGSQQVLLSAVAPLSAGRIALAPPRVSEGANHSAPRRINLPESGGRGAGFRQTRLLRKSQNILPFRHFGVLHGVLSSLVISNIVTLSLPKTCRSESSARISRRFSRFCRLWTRM